MGEEGEVGQRRSHGQEQAYGERMVPSDLEENPRKPGAIGRRRIPWTDQNQEEEIGDSSGLEMRSDWNTGVIRGDRIATLAIMTTNADYASC